MKSRKRKWWTIFGMIVVLFLSIYLYRDWSYERSLAAAFAKAEELSPGWNSPEKLKAWLEKPVDPHIDELFRIHPYSWMGMTNDVWREKKTFTQLDLDDHPNCKLPEDWLPVFVPRMKDERLEAVKKLYRMMMEEPHDGRAAIVDPTIIWSSLDIYMKLSDNRRDEMEWLVQQGKLNDAMKFTKLEAILAKKFAEMPDALYFFHAYRHALSYTLRTQRCLSMGVISPDLLLDARTTLKEIETFMNLELGFGLARRDIENRYRDYVSNPASWRNLFYGKIQFGKDSWAQIRNFFFGKSG